MFKEKYAIGKDLRNKVHRSEHAAWKAPRNRPSVKRCSRVWARSLKAATCHHWVTEGSRGVRMLGEGEVAHIEILSVPVLCPAELGLAPDTSSDGSAVCFALLS